VSAPRFRRAGLLVLRLAVVAAAGVFLVKGVAWAQVTSTLRSTNLLLLAGVVAINACMMALKASRLRLLLGRFPSFRSCFLAKLTTSAINNVLPFRGGDMARVWMLERHAGITKSSAAAVAVVEALFELVSLAAISFLGALASRGQRWATGTASLLLGAAVVLLWLLKRVNVNGATTPAEGGRARNPLGPIRRLIERVEPGLRALRQPRTIAVAMALSFGIWILEIAMVMLCARAIHLSIGPALATLVLLGINLAMALPSMPASAGAFEGGATLVLVLSGLAKGPAIAFALLYHVVQVVPVTLAGLAVVSKLGVTLDRLPASESTK
jgi:uncharacterized protein (TIRG00374 family)